MKQSFKAPKNNRNLRKTRLESTVTSAKSTRDLAQKITLSLTENEVAVDYIKDKIRHISTDNYEDVIVERALNEACGYPLCTSAVSHEFDNQTYIIRSNKVYDITKRKYFCSNICYEASEIVQCQIPSTPLYLREKDKEIKNFRLEIPDKSYLQGKYGSPVNILGPCFEYEDAGSPLAEYLSNKAKLLGELERKKSSVSDLSALHETDLEYSLECQRSDSKKGDCSDSDNNLTDVGSSAAFSALKIDDQEEYHNKEQGTCHGATEVDEHSSPERKQIISDMNAVKPTNPDILKVKLKSGRANPTELIVEVEQIMREWMTFKSLRIILGDYYVRGMLEELAKRWTDYCTSTEVCLSVDSKAKYIELCRQLDSEELTHETESTACENFRVSKSLSGLEQKKKEIEEQTLKVKAFYQGKDEYSSNTDPPVLETILEDDTGEKKEDEQDQMKKNPKRRQQKKNTESYIDSVSLPIVDACEQNTWRQHIVIDKLSKPLSTICCELGLDERQIRKLLKSLILSFDLNPQNIMLKQSQWKYCALIILKMLSVRYPVILKAMTDTRGCEYINSLLSDVSLDVLYLDRVLSYLTEIVYILGKQYASNSLSQSNHDNVSVNSMSDDLGVRNIRDNQAVRNSNNDPVMGCGHQSLNDTERLIAAAQSTDHKENLVHDKDKENTTIVDVPREEITSPMDHNVGASCSECCEMDDSRTISDSSDLCCSVDKVLQDHHNTDHCDIAIINSELGTNLQNITEHFTNYEALD